MSIDLSAPPVPISFEVYPPRTVEREALSRPHLRLRGATNQTDQDGKWWMRQGLNL